MFVDPLLSQSSEHGAEVLVALHGHNAGDDRKRHSGGRRRNGPEGQPILHSASPSAGLTACLGCWNPFPLREPRTRPRAASPNAEKAVIFSLQCRKKNGTIAAGPRINLAIYPPPGCA